MSGWVDCWRKKYPFKDNNYQNVLIMSPFLIYSHPRKWLNVSLEKPRRKPCRINFYSVAGFFLTEPCFFFLWRALGLWLKLGNCFRGSVFLLWWLKSYFPLTEPWKVQKLYYFMTSSIDVGLEKFIQ